MRALVVRRGRLVCLYCRPHARTATRQAATGAVGLRALAVRRAIYACLYCRPRARTAMRQAATGVVRLRAHDKGVLSRA